MAGDMGVPFLGGIPIEPAIVTGGDEGTPFGLAENPETGAGKAFADIVEVILAKEQIRN